MPYISKAETGSRVSHMHPHMHSLNIDLCLCVCECVYFGFLHGRDEDHTNFWRHHVNVEVEILSSWEQSDFGGDSPQSV